MVVGVRGDGGGAGGSEQYPLFSRGYFLPSYVYAYIFKAHSSASKWQACMYIPIGIADFTAITPLLVYVLCSVNEWLDDFELNPYQ